MTAEETTEQEPAPGRRFRGPGFFKPMVAICAIVVIECVAAAVLLPTAGDTEELGRDLVAARMNASDAPPDAAGPIATGPREEMREVSLGDYHIAIFQPQSNTTLRIDLELYGIVLADDQSEFERLYSQHEHRLSEQVQASFRAAAIGDLTDAGLGLIKRQILEKSNRTLGKPLLKRVVFSKFNFMEQ